MSKLADQKALPRRPLFRRADTKVDLALAMDIGIVKRKRAKKAKGKR
jgi:hypothetical protein